VEEKKRGSEYLPRRAVGEVIGVEVHAGDERPVRVTCHGHAHSYEIAWRDTPEGPGITDLRVKAHDGALITSDDLKRINATVLARAARRYDTPEAVEQRRELRAAVDAATAHLRGDPAAMIASACEGLDAFDNPAAAELARRLRGLDPVEAAEWVATAGEGLETMRITGTNIRDMATRAGLITETRGRKPLTPEFLKQVAEWAREAKDDNAGNIYDHIAVRASAVRGYKVSTDMVKKWLRRCRDAGELGRDELRQPRKPRTPSREDR
jgi:hypothetical protein